MKFNPLIFGSWIISGMICTNILLFGPSGPRLSLAETVPYTVGANLAGAFFGPLTILLFFDGSTCVAKCERSK